MCKCYCIIFSCTNDSSTPETPESNFYALTVGNSWVYKNYKYNTDTEAYEDTGVIDSVSIVTTETFNDNVYFKFRRLTTGNEAQITFCNPNGEHFELLRDSLGSLVNHHGIVKFTNNNYSERLLSDEGWGNIYEKLIEGSTELSVESGIFTSINSERYAVLSNGEQTPAIDKFYYSDGFGLIYDTSSFVSSETPSVIRRLDSYDIQ